MGRVKYAARNIMFGYVSNIITLLLNAILRYVFIMRLDETLLGINSTYTNILSVLSLAELGVGTAINSVSMPRLRKVTGKRLRLTCSLTKRHSA